MVKIIMRKWAFCGMLSLLLGIVLAMGQTTRPRAQAHASENTNKDDLESQETSNQTVSLPNPKAADTPVNSSTFDSVDEWRANARRSKETIATLMTALVGTDEAVQLQAVMALGGKGAEAKIAVPALEKMLQAAKPAVRLEAVIALGRIGPDAKTAISKLETLQHDEDTAVRNAANEALRSVRWQLRTPCELNDLPASVIRNGKTICLNIAPRDDAPLHPPEGWCGEVAVQEALLYYGAFFPQQIINAAGKPEHPDLYASEIPTALRNLHANFQEWPFGKPRQQIKQYLTWVRRQIAAGSPVLTGVKLYPTEHDNWTLDHFCLVVGTDEKAMLFNTAWGYRETYTDNQLVSFEEGFSFENKYHDYYGISIQGLKLPADGLPVRLCVLSETSNTMNVVVVCEKLEPGQRYALFCSADPSHASQEPLTRFEAQQASFALYDQIGKDQPSIYWLQKETAARR